MMLKRISLLAAMALAALTFAVPAAQADTEWSDTGEFPLSGNISTDYLGLQVGPVPVAFTLRVSSNETQGEVTEGSASEPAPTNLPNCTAQFTFKNFPWPVELTTPDTIDIEEITIEKHYSAGCAAFGVPSTTRVFGDATGTVENHHLGFCINLNLYGDHMHHEEIFEGQTVDLTSPSDDLCVDGVEA